MSAEQELGSYTVCRVCGVQNDKSALRLTCRSFEGREVSYIRCAACETMQIEPFPDAADVLAFYRKDYYGCGGSKFVSGIDSLRNIFIRKRAAAMAAIIGGAAGKRVLDVGCGSGTFLAFMAGLGAEAYGTELDGPAYERAKALAGVAVCAADVTDDLFRGVMFNMVTLWHVLEHTLDPAEVLKACSRKLRSGGILAVEVPRVESGQAVRYGSDWLHLDPPRHVYQFSEKAMRQMLADAGLVIEGRRTAAFEMGAMGELQSMLNRHLRRRDLFYNMLSTRNRCPGSFAEKFKSLALALLFSEPALVIAANEIRRGEGVILRFICRKR